MSENPLNIHEKYPSITLTSYEMNEDDLRIIQIAAICGVPSMKIANIRLIYMDVWEEITLKTIKECVIRLSDFPELIDVVSSTQLTLTDGAKNALMEEITLHSYHKALIECCLSHQNAWCIDYLYSAGISNGIFNNYFLRILFYVNHADDYISSLKFGTPPLYIQYSTMMNTIIEHLSEAFLKSRNNRLLLSLFQLRYTNNTFLFHDFSPKLLHTDVLTPVLNLIEEDQELLPGLGLALLLNGNLSHSERLLRVYDTQTGSTLYPFTMQAFIHADSSKALSLYDETITAWRKKTKKRSKIPNTPFTIIYLFLKAISDPLNSEVYHKQSDTIDDFFEHRLWFAHLVRGLKDTFPKHFIARVDNTCMWSGLFNSLAWYWFYKGSDKQSILPNFTRHLAQDYFNHGAPLLGLHLSDLYPEHYDAKEIEHLKKLFPDIRSLKGLYVVQQDWEKVLSTLSLLAPTDRPEELEDDEPESRIIWKLLPPSTIYNYEEIDLVPTEQKRTKSGGWTKGRAIALKKLKEHKVPNMLQQDKDAGRCITESSHRGYWGSGKDYELNTSKALIALMGHPYIYHVDRDIFIDLHKAEPELTLRKSDTGYGLSFNIPMGHATTQLIETGKNRFGVIEISNKLQTIAAAFKNSNTEIPLAAEKQLYEVLNGVANTITIHSESGSSIGGQQIEATPIDPQSGLICRFTEQEEGWSIEILVRPFGDQGTSYPPGEGAQTVFATIDKKPHVTTRSLSTETTEFNHILNSAPTFNHAVLQQGGTIPDLEECLTVLRELFPLQDSITVEWPDKKAVTISSVVDYSSMKMKAKKEKDWFTLEGKLKIDSDTVFAMSELLERLDRSPTKGFIQLDGDKYLAITDELHNHLQALNDLGTVKDDLLQVNSLLLPQVEELLEESGNATRNAGWKKQIEKMDALNEFVPVLPSTFQAELRDYQREGFDWLSTLYEWGVGACLADDMGLGKTIQSLALLVSVAEKGPSLILAPVSVCFNWEQECRRFAPTLNPVILSEGHRATIISEAKPYDLIICTYGLLNYEIKRLKEVSWNTVIYDEAQALKNSNTKRSKAAKSIPAAHKVITTGTPIENHIGELWNLFDLINPGLLGSQEQFSNRFGVPIAIEQSHKKRVSLKRIVSPFILRRLKSAVLTELPEKTEITLSVEMNPDERALYEAVRQKAEALTDNIAAEPSKAKGQKHLEILKEIMRLRQACCHPRLIDSSSTISSSKLNLFGDIVTELIENNHKTLVFSQFTSHLALIREYLDRQKITYQYLDGSVPQAKRKKAVEAFQRGEGDLFLISLKAGGSGLNLTAADYVIHMDPWWNPAVEDQASDRAHRIGQKRPVTIYRMVAKGTIEEKILELHKEKKDLADSLLEGTSKAGKLNASELMALLRGED
ncbi:MAG: DEAD/DEAH box helicase [Fibrobacterales bacterium]